MFKIFIIQGRGQGWAGVHLKGLTLFKRVGGEIVSNDFSIYFQGIESSKLNTEIFCSTEA